MGKGISKLSVLKAALVAAYIFAFVCVVGYIVMNNDVPVLNPQGTIADQQRTLIIIAALLMLIVVLPVFALTFGIALKYRAGNTKAKRAPNWDHNIVLESIWWGIPCLIIAVLAVFAYTSSHQLDPFKALNSDKQAIKVQVVALQWKWLFIYPEQGVASVNDVRFPVGTPVDFEITSDAPMNSFWIPSLGGQIYAMSGMSSQLHLMADKVGTYNGSSANISGEGFAGMKFTAQAVGDVDFQNWVQSIRSKSKALDVASYNELAPPSKNNPVATYRLADVGLYDKIIDKYMGSTGEEPHDGHDHGGSH